MNEVQKWPPKRGHFYTQKYRFSYGRMHPKQHFLGVFRPILGSVLDPVYVIFLTQTCFGIGPKMVQKRVEKRNFLQLNVFDPFWDLFWNPFWLKTSPKVVLRDPKKWPINGSPWEPPFRPFLGSLLGSVLEPVLAQNLTQSGSEGGPKMTPKRGHFWPPPNWTSVNPSVYIGVS